MHVSIRNLAKSFGRVAALREASFDVAAGEIVALVGANGAGKTTLLRALAGIVAPDGGEIHYDGELFRRDRLDLRRRLFLLADLPPVIPSMTVLRHIGMVVGLYEAERPGLEEGICTLLEEFDILPLVESRFSTLSGGRRTRPAWRRCCWRARTCGCSTNRSARGSIRRGSPCCGGMCGPRRPAARR